MKRIMLAALTAALFVGLVAVPASASVSGAGILAQGDARVGTTNGGDCTKTSAGTVGGNGIYAPGFRPGSDSNDKKFSLTVNSSSGGVIVAVNSLGHASTGELNICGNVTGVPVAGGPFCGMSKGYNGIGRLTLTDQVTGDTVTTNLFDVGWKASAGTILPVIGNTQEVDNGVKTGKYGLLVALVSARSLPGTVDGGQSCIDTAGGRHFKVDGITAILNTGDEPADWNDVACKGSGCLYPEKPKS